MIEIKNLCAGYDGREILHGIDCTFNEGSFTAVIGANGCGKTTLLRCIAGQIRYDGQIFISGKDAAREVSLARKVSYLVENKAEANITVQMLVSHGRFPYLGFPRRLTKTDVITVEQSMERMNLTEIRNEYLQNLSGGQRQRAYIAMALCQDTRILLLDEPTVNLDVAARIELADILNELKSDRIIIAVYHDINEAVKYSDEICVMKDGKILAFDRPDIIVKGDCIQSAFEIGMTVCESQGEYFLSFRKNT